MSPDELLAIKQQAAGAYPRRAHNDTAMVASRTLDQLLCELYDQGYSYRELARFIEADFQDVYRRVRRHRGRLIAT